MGYVAWSVVFGEQPSASKWNILGANDASFNDGTGIADDKILTRHIADSQLNANLVDWSTSGEIWWEELGRTTLGVAGDTISVTPIAARKYLRVYAILLNTGTLLGHIRFNNDSGNNYSYKGSTNYGAAADGTSQAQIAGWLSGADAGFVTLDIINISNQNKSVILQEGGVGGAASAAPFSVELRGKWVNTSSQITRIDFINAQTGDFSAGSEVVVLGHD